MKKLMPMTDFVLEQNNIQEEGIIQAYNKIVAYAEFLKQPLTLGMFVPVDEAGNVLNEPEDYEYFVSDNEQYFNGDLEKCTEYNEAQEKVLFEDCEVKEIKSDKNYFVVYHKSRQIWICWTDRIIEDMILNRIYLNDLELTPSALKQIGL